MTKQKNKTHQLPWLKPVIIIFCILVLLAGTGLLIFQNLQTPSDYIVQTSPLFAPFEFYDGPNMAGVDIDIINRVAAKMNKTINITTAEFPIIIDNVAAGELADAGAAGFTITESRAEKVNFSIPYYTSIQYVIFDSRNPINSHADFVTWDDVKGKIIGTETGTTSWIFADSEIKEGSLVDSNTSLKGFESAQLASDAIFANIDDIAISDKLAAQFITSKNSNLSCLPLYTKATDTDTFVPVEESYAIAVNKNHPELLQAINDTLQEMIDSGEIDSLILKYMSRE